MRPPAKGDAGTKLAAADVRDAGSEPVMEVTVFTAAPAAPTTASCSTSAVAERATATALLAGSVTTVAFATAAVALCACGMARSVLELITVFDPPSDDPP